MSQRRRSHSEPARLPRGYVDRGTSPRIPTAHHENHEAGAEPEPKMGGNDNTTSQDQESDNTRSEQRQGIRQALANGYRSPGDVLPKASRVHPIMIPESRFISRRSDLNYKYNTGVFAVKARAALVEKSHGGSRSATPEAAMGNGGYVPPAPSTPDKFTTNSQTTPPAPVTVASPPAVKKYASGPPKTVPKPETLLHHSPPKSAHSILAASDTHPYPHPHPHPHPHSIPHPPRPSRTTSHAHVRFESVQLESEWKELYSGVASGADNINHTNNADGDTDDTDGESDTSEDEEEKRESGVRDDDLEKRFMPRREEISAENRRDSKKALKLLGLA